MRFGCWLRASPSSKMEKSPSSPLMKLEVMNHPGSVTISTGLGIRDSTASTLKELIQKVDEQNLAMKANTAAIAKLNERIEGDKRLVGREVLDLKEIFGERITEVERKTMRNDSKVTGCWKDKLEKKVKGMMRQTFNKVLEDTRKKLDGDYLKMCKGDDSQVINNLDERREEIYEKGAKEIVDAMLWEIPVNGPGLLKGVLRALFVGGIELGGLASS